MNTSPILIEGVNLSEAWRITLERTVADSNHEITPLVLSLSNFEESKHIRNILDRELKKDKKGSVETVSETIFPESIYRLYNHDRYAFYEGYLDILPQIKKIDARSNSRGTYFERLIAYRGTTGKINQLEIIISSLKDKQNRRRSKLQASVFDPTTDHTNSPYQRFPCLQHVTFYVTSNGLVLNSFYAIQYLYERAYGNWLGLINLGKFVANELDLKFDKFNCYIGVEKLDMNTSKARELLKMTN
ncbi:MAG: thymidylate synthase [Sphingobacteriales bacterium]|nr:MAG: thymidylate synthase [Sphingobacteriales bacterium]